MGKNSKFSLEDLLKEVNMTTKVAMEDESKESKKHEKSESKDDEKKEEKEYAKKDKKEDKKQDKDSPVDDAMKMAEKLASLEKEALQKEAELLGKAICDGFVSRMTQYEKTAQEELTPEKVAHLYNTDADFRTSMDAGYQDKIAEEIQKDPEALAAFREGYTKTAAALNGNMEKNAAELVKVAEFMIEKGYGDFGRVTEKVANLKR